MATEFDTVLRIINDDPFTPFAKEYLRTNYAVIVGAPGDEEKKRVLEVLQATISPPPAPSSGAAAAAVLAATAPGYVWRNGRLYDPNGNRAFFEVPAEVSFYRDETISQRFEYDGHVRVYVDEVLSEGHEGAEPEDLVDNIITIAAERAHDNAEVVHSGDSGFGEEYDLESEVLRAELHDDVSALLEDLGVAESSDEEES